jgi:hypothetical protein
MRYMLQQHGAALDLLQKMSEKMREKTHEKARGKRAANQKVSRKGAPAAQRQRPGGSGVEPAATAL